MVVDEMPAGRPPLEGEDLATAHWEDARHWLSVYADLLRFKRRLLDRVHIDLPKLGPVARRAASEDIGIIESQMEGYLVRIDLWYQRVWDLQGLWIDPKDRVVRHKEHEAKLTEREYQLLQFLLDHPHRYFSAEQIMTRAWADSGLFPEEVRNYILKIRKMLVRLEIPCELVNRPGRGYSLVYRTDIKST
ncbi:MAG: winged helix-turn-helix domain-containing protein [Candidatus Dormibacteria bacterium]